MKKTTKRCVSLLLTLLLTVSLLPTAAFAALSGSCGTNVTWTLDNGTLTVSGTGAMTDYGAADDAPWENYRAEITAVVIGNGVTSVGNRTFWFCENLASVSLADSVTVLGQYAFNNCPSLTTVTIPKNVINIKANCFSFTRAGESNMESIYFSTEITRFENISNSAFRNCEAKIFIPKGLQVGYPTATEVTLENSSAYFSVNPVYFLNSNATITWKNADGTLLETEPNATPDVLPTYHGATPVKESDAGYSYTFAGWTPELVPVCGDMTYTATFTAQALTATHTVTFRLDGGSIDGSTDDVVYEVAENDPIVPPAVPTRYGYTFLGWDPDLSDFMYDEDQEYRATWERNDFIEVGFHSLSLNGDIGVNFYADIPNVTSAAYAAFTVDGKSVTVPINLNKYKDQDGVRYYKFTCNVAAAQIDTEISGVICNGENESAPFTYTVQDYLTEAQQKMGSNERFMALAGSLATYGYYANELFAFDDDFHQHALFDDSGFAAVTAASLADYAAQITNEADGVNYVGSSLVMRTETTIKHYFTLPAGKTLDDYTFLLGEGDTAVELTPQISGNYICVEIPDIGSGNLGTAYTVTVLDGNGSAVNTWTYSAMSYAYKALTKYEANDPSVSDALANAVKALTFYYQAADAYFSQNNA